MVLVILLTNTLIIKIEMMKVTQKTNKHKKAKRKFSRKAYAPKNISHHQMKMKSVSVRQKEFHSWQLKTLIKKTLKKNMKKHKKNMKKSKKKLKRRKLTTERTF
jgi:hypothetical protein